MSLKQDTRVAPAGTTLRGRPRLAGEGAQRAGLLVVVVGAVLLGLAADDALAGAVLGGGAADSLQGSGGGETLVGFAPGWFWARCLCAPSDRAEQLAYTVALSMALVPAVPGGRGPVLRRVPHPTQPA